MRAFAFGVLSKAFMLIFLIGLAFCALIHKFNPSKLDFSKLKKEDKRKNLQLAFDVAESLGIPALLDVSTSYSYHN